MGKNNPFNETIDNLKETTKSIDEATRDKNDNSDAVNEDPAYVLYNAISETSIELLQNPIVVDIFKKLSDEMGDELSKSMVEMFAIMLTQSAYNAVILYDSLLKSELDNQFNHFAEHLNMVTADVKAHNGALKVFKKQLNDIQDNLKIEKMRKENKV